YGLTTALGLSANVAQAASCEVGTGGTSTAGTCHTGKLTGLLPRTRHVYRLRTNGVIVQDVSTSTYFTTLKSAADVLTQLFFTVVGDFGACPNSSSPFSSSPSPGNGTQQQAIANEQNVADPPLLMTVGDNAYQNGT